MRDRKVGRGKKGRGVIEVSAPGGRLGGHRRGHETHKQNRRKEIEEAIRSTGLQLDPDRRQVFVLRYAQERRKIEEQLRSEMEQKRQTMLREMIVNLVDNAQKHTPGGTPIRIAVKAWPALIEEFRRIRLSTLSFFINLPSEGWMRSGIASDNRFTVRAVAYIIAGHFTHHLALLRERYF